MWTDLTTRHLLALRAVHEEGTFGRAAEQLGFTQSAVSQQIGALEQIVGVSLFDRKPGPNPPTLTEAGALLLSHAGQLLAAVEQAQYDLDRLARGLTGTLRVGTFQSVSARLLPMAIRRIYDEAPDVEVILEDAPDADSRIDALLRGEVDLSFAVGEVDPDLTSRRLGADPHVAIVPAGEPDGPLDLAGTSGRAFVGLPADDGCGRIVDRSLAAVGVTPRYAFRSFDNGAVQGMVAAGMGVAIMPLLTVDSADPAISVRKVVPELEPRVISIAWDGTRELSPVARKFVDIVSEICELELGDTVLSQTGER